MTFFKFFCWFVLSCAALYSCLLALEKAAGVMLCGACAARRAAGHRGRTVLCRREDVHCRDGRGRCRWCDCELDGNNRKKKI